jgi:hypothetical protein
LAELSLNDAHLIPDDMRLDEFVGTLFLPLETLQLQCLLVLLGLDLHFIFVAILDIVELSFDDEEEVVRFLTFTIEIVLILAGLLLQVVGEIEQLIVFESLHHGEGAKQIHLSPDQFLVEGLCFHFGSLGQDDDSLIFEDMHEDVL